MYHVHFPPSEPEHYTLNKPGHSFCPKSFWIGNNMHTF